MINKKKQKKKKCKGVKFSARQPAKARQGNQGDYQPSGKVISVIRSKRKLF
jgi:hypothetical protein